MPERKKRLKQKGKPKCPQRKPHRNYFGELASTPEGQEQFRQWAALAGRKPGTPDGHSAESIKKLREKNRKEARKVVEAMNVEHEGMSESEAEKATDLLTELYSMAKTDSDMRTRLQAAKTFLEWTKPKPVQKNEVTISQAEAFLAELAKQE